MAAPLRPTSHTALPAVRQLGADLARWVRDLGPLGAAPGLADDVDAALASTHETMLDIDVLIEEGTSGERLDGVAARVHPGLRGADIANPTASRDPIVLTEAATGSVCRIRSIAATGSRAEAAGTVRASIVVAASTTASDGFLDAVAACSEDRPLLIWIGAVPGPSRTTAWAMDVLDTQGPATVWERLQSPPYRELHGLFRAAASLRALVSLAAVSGTALEQELRGLRARRAIAQQSAARVQQRPQLSGNELLGEVRTRVQRQFTEFLRGVEDRATETLAPLTGPVWRDVDDQLRTIDELEREPRVKTTALRLMPSQVDGWLEDLESRVSAHCVADLVAMRDMFRLVEADVEQIVTGAGGPPVVARLQFLHDERLRRLLSTHLVVQRPYAGEIPRPGLFEYAMVARRYQMIVFMFISAFGLSFLRTYREFMIPSAVLLLSLGGLNVYVSVRRERAETMEKELERAREALRTEMRRMLTEIQRAWVGVLTQHLADQVTALLGQVESAVRAHQEREAGTVSHERQRIQRQLQAIETTERKLVAAARTRDTTAASLAQLRSELRPLVSAAVKPPVARV